MAQGARPERESHGWRAKYRTLAGMGVEILEEKYLESFLPSCVGSWAISGHLITLYLLLSFLRHVTVFMNINKYAKGLFLKIK